MFAGAAGSGKCSAAEFGAVLKRQEVCVRQGSERVSWRSNLRRLIRFTLEDLAEMAHTLVHCLQFRDISNLFKTLCRDVPSGSVTTALMNHLTLCFCAFSFKTSHHKGKDNFLIFVLCKINYSIPFRQFLPDNTNH